MVGGGFAGQLSEWLLAHYAGKLEKVIVFVPTARVAARVRALLSAEMTGVLPAVLPLKGNGELADLLGLQAAAVGRQEAVMVEIAKLLKAQAGEDEGGLEAVKGERLWRRVTELYRVLDRLALYGISVSDLRRTVPESMVGLWEAQAATLVRVTSHIERWLARRGEVLAGANERRILEQAAEVLGREDCEWIPVVAGEVNLGVRNQESGVRSGVAATLGIADVAARKGAVIFPDLGPVTKELIAEAEEVLRHSGERFVVDSGGIRECVAESDWDEAWVAALGVKRAVDAGLKRVAVVSPSHALLRRVSGLLARWGMAVPVSGELCMDHTPAGREVMAVTSWGMGAGKPSDWLSAMMGHEVDGGILGALEPLRELDAWLDADDWRALMGAVLGSTAAPARPVTEGVFLLGPLDARLLDFDYVIAAGCVEGTWPSGGQDKWLSEAHLRALGLPDMEKRAKLAGTEFESVVAGGSGEVLVTRARVVEGKETVASRFIRGLQDYGVVGLQDETELLEVLGEVKAGAVRHDGVLGVFVPEGDLWPSNWSASLTEAMLACPYKAMGERVLRLEPPEPLLPVPDARTAGLLAHRWLEKAGKELPEIIEENADKAVARLLEMAAFELRHEPAVVRAIWQAKFAKLAPALVAQWLADGRQVAAVETRLSKTVGAVTVTAKLDRVEARGGKVIIDFKTSTPPSWAQVASGEKPQLAMEAWLLGADGEAVEDVEYWQLRGYGANPLVVRRADGKYGVEDLVAPVGEGLARLVETYGNGSPFPAVPDLAGGGLMATGHCSFCALDGVCRRQTVAQSTGVLNHA